MTRRSTVMTDARRRALWSAASTAARPSRAYANPRVEMATWRLMRYATTVTPMTLTDAAARAPRSQDISAMLPSNVERLPAYRLTGNEMCGDGLTLGAEVEMVIFCDDGNTVGGDGCSPTCRVECGYECTGGTSTSADECTSVCGDGIKTASEECDDNNSNNNDGCDSACFIEAGYTCSTPDCALSVCGTVCGDGYVCLQRSFSVVLCFCFVSLAFFWFAFLFLHSKVCCMYGSVAVEDCFDHVISLLLERCTRANT